MLTTMAEETKQEQDAFRSAFGRFLDHQRRAFEETGKAVDALLPEGFKEHSAVARDEFRKSLKVMVDATIDELEKMTKIDPKPEKRAKDESDEDSDDEPPSTTGRTKVKVQVE
jgi:hypothetical protein